jgi:hypothetical protein
MLHITPQNNTIEFQLQIENASIENTSTRLIVNTGDENIITPISIDNEGNCKGIIPLKEEWNGKSGDIKIEVITEGNYFEPFSKKVIFDSIPNTPKAKIEEIILSPSPKTPSPSVQPIIKESKDVKKKPLISKIETPKKITKKQNLTRKNKFIIDRKPTIQPPKPIVKKEIKKEPILELNKPEVKINNEISNEVKSFFLENKNKKTIKENKEIKNKDIEENVAKEAKDFFKSN